MIPKSVLALLSALAIFVTASSSVQAQGRPTRVEVTVTNLTKGQVLSPAVIALHNGRIPPLFKAGEPASDALRQVAEDAVNQPLIDLLSASPDVGQVVTLSGPLPPGTSESIVLEADGNFPFVSLVSMLVTTNDAFTGANSVRAFRFPRVLETDAYDAGTEENNELCEFIPGPPCGSAGVRAMMGEGFVHIHAGVHGVGDLMPAMHDWRNPVARITVERLR